MSIKVTGSDHDLGKEKWLADRGEDRAKDPQWRPFQPIDSDRTTFVSLRDASSKLCEDVAEAVAFVRS